MMLRNACFVLLLAGLSAGLLRAQEARFELGQRLRSFERTLDKHSGAEPRKRALDPLVKATPTFFQGRLGDAGSLLDRARLSLLSAEKPTPAVLWAESLYVVPKTRLLETEATELAVQVKPFYRMTEGKPDKATVRLSLRNSEEKVVASITKPLGELPETVNLPCKAVPEGDYQLRSEIASGATVLASGEQTVSVVKEPTKRLEALREKAKSFSDKERTTEQATVVHLTGMVAEMAKGRTSETNLPAARLLAEAETLTRAIEAKKAWYGPTTTGQFWLSLAGPGRSPDPVRVQIPAEAKKGKPLPLVVAMHGAGGSENMFFDGYGDGLVAKLCAKRGWLLVTTRSGFFGGPDVPKIVDALGKIWPVDEKRVFLVGHSMGASQAVSTAGRAPERFRAVAALGGGGGFRDSEALRGVRFYVGVGDHDFAAGGAKKLHQALEKAKVKKAVLKVYEDVEHLTIVQLALPEVFDFFEEKAGP